MLPARGTQAYFYTLIVVGVISVGIIAVGMFLVGTRVVEIIVVEISLPHNFPHYVRNTRFHTMFQTVDYVSNR